MKEELEEAQGWFHKAESDLATARRTAASEGSYDTTCFHAQQAAEKYLKGFLIACGQGFPYTHDSATGQFSLRAGEAPIFPPTLKSWSF